MSCLFRQVDNPCSAESFEHLTDGMRPSELYAACKKLESIRTQTNNLYRRVRICAIIAAICRFHLQNSATIPHGIPVPRSCWKARLDRRFEAATATLWTKLEQGLGRMLLAELGATYHAWVYAELAEQVQAGVRESQGNRWLFRVREFARIPPQVVSPSRAD